MIKRLRDGKPIYTTRILNELGKWRRGMIVNSTFGLLKITSVKKINKLENFAVF